MNPFGLHFDGDLRRIYEVPENSSHVVDGEGYRIYTPDGEGASMVRITTTYLWSRYSDFYFLNNWSTKALSKTGGAYRYTDTMGTDVYATFDLRLINGWLFVPANYPHQITIEGNLFEEPVMKKTQDSSRITSAGVSFNINFADSLQVAQSGGGGGTVDTAALAEAVWAFLESGSVEPGTMAEALRQARDHARAANNQTKVL